MKYPPVEKFWERVQKTDTCWLWTGGLSAGVATLYGVKAHRWSWEIHRGPIRSKKQMSLIRSCGNTLCVNPDHLFLRTGKHPTVPATERFWRFVKKTKTCWIWTGFLHYGYGNILSGKKMLRAHRLSYEMHCGGPIGMHVCHRCDNRACVRPDHLFLGSAQDNIRDMIDKGRGNTQRLSSAQALEILKSSETAESLARRFGVTKGRIHCVRRRQTFRWLSSQ